MKDMTAQTGTL